MIKSFFRGKASLKLVRKETAVLTYKSLKLLASGYFRKLFIKCPYDRERVLSSTESETKNTAAENDQWPKGFFSPRCETMEQSRKSDKLAPSLKTHKEQL